MQLRGDWAQVLPQRGRGGGGGGGGGAFTKFLGESSGENEKTLACASSRYRISFPTAICVRHFDLNCFKRSYCLCWSRSRSALCGPCL